ncbi:unnamed protein product [Chrysoparadoxa australica]
MQRIALLCGLALLGKAWGQLPTIGFGDDGPTIIPADNDLVVESVWDMGWTAGGDVPVQIVFVPGSEKVVVIGKTGIIRLYDSIDADVDDYAPIADLRPIVWSGGDHGMLSFAFHPDYLQGQKEAYVLYTGEPQFVDDLPNDVSAIRPPAWGTLENNGHYWEDYCPCLSCTNDGDNLLGSVCEHPYYLDKMYVDVDAPEAYAVIVNRLFTSACGSSSTHGTGTIQFVDKDLVFAVGDGSQYLEFEGLYDYGLEQDGCWEPDMGLDQGMFRAQREDFKNGKITRIPYELLLSDVELTFDQVTLMGKGLRNPFRMFYHETADTLYIGDVGFGDGYTSERLFARPGMMTDECIHNFGWPCVEGLFPLPYDSPSEQAREEYLLTNGLTTCDEVFTSVSDAVYGLPPSPGASPCFGAPIFEYRDIVDPEHTGKCGSNVASVTGVYIYEGDKLPAEYTNKLIFTDHSKNCLWYFTANDDGTPNTDDPPKLLLQGNGFVDLKTGNDGFLYMVDHARGRVVRMYDKDAAPGDVVIDETPVEKEPEPEAFDDSGMIVPTAETCVSPYAMPELEWTTDADGVKSATISLGAAEWTDSHGTTRSRLYNGQLPGPVMRMEACGVYKLTLINDMEGWPNPTGPMNTMKEPSTTNLHLHGMHVSGMVPGDNVFVEIEPGEERIYTYHIPCDHSSGTHWYHPHHHGSSTLQTGAGSAGLLLVDTNQQTEGLMPIEYHEMPEALLVVSEMLPAAMEVSAIQAGDALFKTTAETNHWLVNGCDATAFEIKAGEWTRLRMLYIGHELNARMELVNADACEMGLLAKDGVWLSDVPRMLPTNTLFFSIASRVDVAVKCPLNTAGESYDLGISYVGTQGEPEPITIATVVVSEGEAEAAPLPEWTPCRPYYLQDLTGFTTDEIPGNPFPIEVRETLNQQLFTGPENYLTTMNIDEVQEWVLTGHGIHPLHMHVNHIQLNTVNAQWEAVPNWFQQGDWLDTISSPGVVVARFRTERYAGPMVVHCHVLKHADTGVVAVLNIAANPVGGLANSQEITNWGTCLPPKDNEPFGNGGEPWPMPGVIEAEDFDIGGEAYAYHNVNEDGLGNNAYRPDEHVEIREIQGGSGGYYVSLIEAGEWLAYTVDAPDSGEYKISLNLAAARVPEGLNWSLFADTSGCDEGAEGGKELLQVVDPQFTGTTGGRFEPYSPDGTFLLAAGQHKLTLCFPTNAYFQLNSIETILVRVVEIGNEVEDQGTPGLKGAISGAASYFTGGWAVKVGVAVVVALTAQLM